nr:hypothetical protein [Tanacetum cinerariifolium]GEY77160.1 hypothetical protein [Tanacetum cinerariifolium]
MVVAAQNTNNTTIRYEKKIKFVKQPTRPQLDPETAYPDTIDKYYETVNLEQEVACIMLSSHVMPNELGASLIFNSLNKDYDQLVQNYNMQNIGKTIAELHAMLKHHEKIIPKKAETPAVLAIREGKIQKDKKKPKGANGKDKEKNNLAYVPKPKISSPPKIDNPKKDSICHQCKEVGHWRRNCPPYQAELKKMKNASMASTSGIFTIELYAFPNKTWVNDTGCGTHICNTSQGRKGRRNLKHGGLSLYMGNGMRVVVEACGKQEGG